MEVRKREGESIGSLIYRFTKRTQQSGIIREVKKRRFRDRPLSRVKRKLSALHKARQRAEYAKAKKLGNV